MQHNDNLLFPFIMVTMAVNSLAVIKVLKKACRNYEAVFPASIGELVFRCSPAIYFCWEANILTYQSIPVMNENGL
jgi:hypothetical protein